MSKYTKIINFMVNLYKKNIIFMLVFCLIAIGIGGLLHFCIPTTSILTTIIRVLLEVLWSGFSFSIMIASLMEYKYGDKNE